MDCRELDRDELVEKYLRGELGSAAQDEFETHILECAGCLQALETFQAIWDDLTRRAHEIRVQPPVRRVRFRWEWIAVMSVLAVACGMGFVWHHRAGLTASSKPQTPALSNPTTPTEPTKEANVKSISPAVPVPARQQHEGKPQSTATSDHSPGVVPFAPSSQEAKNTGPAVPAGVPTPAASSKNEQIATDVTHLAAAVPQSKLASNEAASDDVAKELFRLGVVQAPPYTFSGFAASTKGGKPHKAGPAHESGLGAAKSSTEAERTNSADPGRAHFQNAMDAYVEKRYADAADLLEEAVTVEPNAADANFFLGVCRLLQGKAADSIAPLKTALANERSPFTQSAHFYLAKAYIQTGDLTEATTQLQVAAAMAGRLTAEASSMLARLQALRASEKGQSSP